MVLEPARDLKVTFKLPLEGEQNLTFSNNFKVSDMLQALHDKKMLSRPVEDYYIVHGATELDLDMPLHVYNIERGVVQVLPATFGVQIVDEYDDKLYITVNTKTDTILDVKKMIANNYNVEYTDKNTNHLKPYKNVSQMRIYIQNGRAYDLLSDECTIKNSGAENNTKLYLVYYDWVFSASHQFYHYTQVPEPQKVYKPENVERELEFVGQNCIGRTVLSVALRLQEQLNVPVQKIQMYKLYRSYSSELKSNVWTYVEPYELKDRCDSSYNVIFVKYS